VSVLMLLISPITWKQHCVAVIPAVYLLARTMIRERGLPRGLATWLLAGYVLLGMVIQRGTLGRETMALMDSYHIKTLALMCLLVLSLLMWRRTDEKLAGPSAAGPVVAR
jgi:hypothetical protein